MEWSHLVATPNQHSDLYWTLSGGVGGTVPVVLSRSARLQPGGIVGGTVLDFNNSVVGKNDYWKPLGMEIYSAICRSPYRQARLT